MKAQNCKNTYINNMKINKGLYDFMNKYSDFFFLYLCLNFSPQQMHIKYGFADQIYGEKIKKIIIQIIKI